MNFPPDFLSVRDSDLVGGRGIPKAVGPGLLRLPWGLSGWLLANLLLLAESRTRPSTSQNFWTSIKEAHIITLRETCWFQTIILCGENWFTVMHVWLNALFSAIEINFVRQIESHRRLFYEITTLCFNVGIHVLKLDPGNWKPITGTKSIFSLFI